MSIGKVSHSRDTFDPLSAIEAAYAWEDSAEDWLRSIARAMLPMEAGFGAYARIDDLSRPEAPRVKAGVWERGTVAGWMDVVNRLQAGAPPQLMRALYEQLPPVAYVRDRLRALPLEMQDSWTRSRAAVGIRDVLGVFAHDIDGQCVHLGIPLPTPRRFHPRTVHRLSRVAAHLTSAVRLRRAGSSPSTDSAGTDAVIAPSGEVQHAVGAARERGARERLARAARDVERARGRLRRADPDRALAIWRGLVDGTWSLVDHWDSDGRRYVLARENSPTLLDPKALTRRESVIVAFLARGYSEKYVAYLLGVSATTVAMQFASARRKLGVRSRQELIALFSSSGPSRR